MEERRRYRIIIGALLLVIILQGAFIATRLPGKARRPAALKARGRIAVVIDDWGYNLNNLDILSRLKCPLTASVLPNLNYSAQVAEELHQRGLEVILHLPMEPYEKYRLEKNTIMASMDEADIAGIIERDLANVVYAKGVSNHMGSRATEDPRTMEAVFKELKKRRLYFLDSFVSGRSRCSALAEKMKLGFARRDIFLDNKNDPAYIRMQLNKLKKKAKSCGQAIGIGHDRQTTLEVLAEAIPQIEKEGYKFVFVSDLLH